MKNSSAVPIVSLLVLALEEDDILRSRGGRSLKDLNRTLTECTIQCTQIIPISPTNAILFSRDEDPEFFTTDPNPAQLKKNPDLT